MVFVILLGLLCIGVLSEKSRIKGLISGGLGLLFSFIGYQVVTGIPRFTFGSAYLYDGLPLLPFVLGLFAMPVMIELIMQQGTIAKQKVVTRGIRDVLQGGKDVIRNWGIFLRSSVIGYIVGIVPGIGAMTATWVSYGQAKATSKNADAYGTGNKEGLIAATCSTNASLGGDLLVTLALGIPGSSLMAVLLGGMMMVRLVPGPGMLTDHLGLSLSLIYIVVIANILGAAICILFVPQMTKIASVPVGILVAIIVPIIFVGTFAPTEHFNDLFVLAIATILGVFMQKFNYSRPALFVGYILGSLFEKYFFLAYSSFGPVFFMRPISLTLIAIMLALLTYKPLKRLFALIFRHEGNTV